MHSRDTYILLYTHENKYRKCAWNNSLQLALILLVVCAHVTLSQSPKQLPIPTSNHARSPIGPKSPNLRPLKHFPATPNVIFNIPPNTPSKSSHTQTHTHHVRRCVSPIPKNRSAQKLTAHAAPPQPSKRELEAAEAQTLTDIKWTAASCVVLYFCEFGCIWGREIG